MKYGTIFFCNISLFQKQNKPFSFSILAFLILKKGRIKSSNGMKLVFALLKLIFHHTGTPLQIVSFVHFGICLRKSYTELPCTPQFLSFLLPDANKQKKKPEESDFSFLSHAKNGGEGGIRTPGIPRGIRRFSKPLPSATRPPLQNQTCPPKCAYNIKIEGSLSNPFSQIVKIVRRKERGVRSKEGGERRGCGAYAAPHPAPARCTS